MCDTHPKINNNKSKTEQKGRKPKSASMCFDEGLVCLGWICVAHDGTALSRHQSHMD